MATLTDITNLRRITNGAEGYTDQQLNEMFDSGMTERQIAYRIWNEIAASSAVLVDVSESGSTRKLGDLHRQALSMAAAYAPSADIDFGGAPLTTKRTRRAVRG
jgi:hypothetical protein